MPSYLNSKIIIIVCLLVALTDYSFAKIDFAAEGWVASSSVASKGKQVSSSSSQTDIEKQTSSLNTGAVRRLTDMVCRKRTRTSACRRIEAK